MREARYQWHPALRRFVVPETPNILRVRFRTHLVDNEWSLALGMLVFAVGVGLGLVLRDLAIVRWIPVALGALGGVATTVALERRARAWVEIQRRSTYWRVTRGQGRARSAVTTFGMEQVTDAEVEQDEAGMWLVVHVRDRGPLKIVGRSFRWSWVELEAMREELLCPRVSDLC
ncbi:MAG: hypothetical protein NT062_16995 [Proteobacteria bacterium]|nr:hypothetical protein [Pseudomonadota bacterium]